MIVLVIKFVVSVLMLVLAWHVIELAVYYTLRTILKVIGGIK